MTRPRAVPAEPRPTYPVGLTVVLLTVAILFSAFTAALFVRRSGADWVSIALPPWILVNTGALVLSSLAIETARRRLSGGRTADFERWLAVGTLLGLTFLAGQVAVWRWLAAQGYFLPTSPNASFFYMLSALHAVHVIGGLGALMWVWRRVASHDQDDGLRVFGHVAVYWHFVGGLWLYLLTLLSVF